MENNTRDAWIKVLIILSLTFMVGFGFGWMMSQNFNREEEYFYRGVYFTCVAQTKDEVGCLTMQRLVDRKAHEWKMPLFVWPLPPVTPTPRPTEQKQSG